MQFYTFNCPNCNASGEFLRSMKETDRPLRCGLCGTIMNRNFQADLVNAGNKNYRKPLVSDSLAINPEQIQEHKKLFPDVEVTPQGQPVFNNYQQHQKYLDKTGFVKRRQKIKPRGKKI